MRLFKTFIYYKSPATPHRRTTTPRTIRYQPNTIKLCFFMYPIKNLITNIETTNATIIPIMSIADSYPVKWKPNLTSLRRLAPNITGIARKNVYSAAIVLETPISSAPTIVAPEREVPGNTAAIS